MSDVNNAPSENINNNNNDGDNKAVSAIAVVIFFGLFMPIFALSAVATWLAFSIGRIRRSVIASVLGIYMFFTIWFLPTSVSLFIQSFSTIINTIANFGKADVVGGIVSAILQQVLLGIPLGMTVGLLYASFRWWKRPSWVKVEFRVTPRQAWTKKKNISDIKNDKNGPMDGVTLGINPYGAKVVQTDKEASAHTLVVGASGSGKTTTLMSRARDSVRRGQGLVFVDLKGGHDVPRILSKYAKRYNREFIHWTMQGLTSEYIGPDPLGPAYYDPLGRGEATRRKDLLVASRKWSEEYYKLEASNYLQMLFSVLIGAPKEGVSTLADVVALLNPRTLQERAMKLGTNPLYYGIVSSIDSLNDERLGQAKKAAIDGLRSQLEVILNSVAGPWLQLDPKGNHNINLKEAAHKGQVVVFSLDSSNYQELASLVANLIIQDLKTVSSELRDDPARLPLQVYLDEFSAIGSDNVIGLINKSRDAGIPVTLSTQALGDLRRVDPAFLDQLMGIINSFIIHRANKDDDAVVYAGLGGKEWKKKFRQSVSQSTNKFGLGAAKATGGGTIEEIEDYRISPNDIQDLDMGEMIYLTKAPSRIERVTVIPEDASNMEADVTPTRYNENVAKAQNVFETPILPKSEPSVSEVVREQETSTRLSDPDRLKNILNNDEGVAAKINTPFRPAKPVSRESQTGESSLNIKPQASFPTIPSRPSPAATSPVPLPPSKPEIDFEGTKKDTAKDEFDF